MADTPERLALLHDLKQFRVRKGEPDIRGWDVVTADKKRIGEVHELIVDTVDMKVRYLDVDVDNKILDTKKNSHVLIPIAGAQLDDDDNRVYLEQISVDELMALPPYDHRKITREYETNVAGWFEKARRPNPAPATNPAPPQRADSVQAAGVTNADDGFYRQEHFSDRRFWGNRRKGREEVGYFEHEKDSVPEAKNRE
jgi:hypothetical protein